MVKGTVQDPSEADDSGVILAGRLCWRRKTSSGQAGSHGFLSFPICTHESGKRHARVDLVRSGHGSGQTTCEVTWPLPSSMVVSGLPS